MGVGIDLLEIERLERAIARRPRLAERLFTDAEREYAASRARPGQHLAARFCAKEAVAKALRLTAWSWRDIEVLEGPRLVLHGALAGHDVELSLTHTRGMAGAVAVVTSAGGPSLRGPEGETS
jgi:holo-[acyl-carrier protein] synthase